MGPQKILGNELIDLLYATLIVIAGFVFFKYIAAFIARIAFRFYGKTTRLAIGSEQFISLTKKPFHVFLVLLTIFFALSQLTFPPTIQLPGEHVIPVWRTISKFLFASLTASFTWILLRFTDFFGLILMARAAKTESKTDDQLVPFLKESIKILLLAFSLLFILGVIFKFNVASLIAGVGIGGIAIALAAKESLENLLGSFTIFLDKPFVVGDLIKIGSIEGTIEKIGFRSTRIRTLEKTLVTMPNKKLVEAELDNLTLRQLQRVKFDLEIDAATSPEQLQVFTEGIKKVLESETSISPDRHVFFYHFGSVSFVIRVIYFVESDNWTLYMATRERVNYAILKLTKEHQIAFSIPTRQVLLNKAD